MITITLRDRFYRLDVYNRAYPNLFLPVRSCPICDIGFDDGRALATPLRWIPTLYEAPPEERTKYEINRSLTMITGAPKKCILTAALSIAD